MSTIRLSHPTGVIEGTITLDGSKSISNRVLIIRALCKKHFEISKLSTSDDSVTLEGLLTCGGENETYHVGHAGTTFRFLTAYLAIQDGQQILTGSERMLERPIGPLVEALRTIGCNIDYMEKEGYPPLRINACDTGKLRSEVTIDASISSQYITALILIAPALPKGLTIYLAGDMVSESYLQLTLGIVRDFGIEVKYQNQTISLTSQSYTPRAYTIEADWSASSYHYSLVALAKRGELRLNGLFRNSNQGDSGMIEIGRHIGAHSHWDAEVLHLSKAMPDKSFQYNFINQPDVAQTVGIICAANKIENTFTGLKTLRIKETDRIFAMNQELTKISSSFRKMPNRSEETYSIAPGISFEEGTPRFETYKDHRMAMAFAPLALLHPIEINNPEVVTKSYPTFWEDLKSLGFSMKEV